ncbi:hypothetical protein L2E82_17615 [Cichorium intybus]|uniref:Uncharacterized protein n=1 Tax=Cichorium intybus TaxID=13427 RepID=A0ACB9F8R1_CICIN|nr:hypothetical protein L2E82_17615 [Cichorium intybus]
MLLYFRCCSNFVSPVYNLRFLHVQTRFMLKVRLPRFACSSSIPLSFGYPNFSSMCLQLWSSVQSRITKFSVSSNSPTSVHIEAQFPQARFLLTLGSSHIQCPSHLQCSPNSVLSTSVHIEVLYYSTSVLQFSSFSVSSKFSDVQLNFGST